MMLTESLLINQTNFKQKYIYILKSTFVPFSIIFIANIILCILYKYYNLSYDSYGNFIDTLLRRWTLENYDIHIWRISNAMATLCIWAFILFLCNIIQCYMMNHSDYYVNQQANNTFYYVITSIVFFEYILYLLLAVDMAASIIPETFLYVFLGINNFYYIAWTFGIAKSCKCCNGHRWYLIITISLVVFTAGLLTMGFLECMHVFGATPPVSYSQVSLFIFPIWFCLLFIVPIINVILFIAVTIYTLSLPSLLKFQYGQNIINQNVLRIIENKIFRAGIYCLFIIGILSASIYRGKNYKSLNKYWYFDQNLVDFLSNLIVLSLLSLILWFKRPLFHTYLICSQCKSPYLKSEHCQICGESTMKMSRSSIAINSNEQATDSSVQLAPMNDSNMVTAIYEPSMDSNAQLLLINDQSVPHHSISVNIDTNCNAKDLSQCAVLNRICMLSSHEVFVDSSQDQFMERLNTTYGDHCDQVMGILNDYIHVIDQHDNTVQDCKCDEYSSTRSSNIDLNGEYIVELMGDIHCFLYHNIQRGRDSNQWRRRGMFDQESHQDSHQYDEDNKNADDNKDDHVDEDIYSLSYGFGAFMYYDLLRCRADSFKQEMKSHITINEWNFIYRAAKHLVNTDYAKGLVSKNNHNNIFKIQPIQIGDILAIKFYTDLDNAQYEFRKSFRKTAENDTDKDVIERHVNNYYFWGKWLNHAITVYGQKIDNNKNITYYHGLSERFMFSSLRTDFNIPTSVTTNQIVAYNFAKPNGIMLQLKCQWNFESKWNRSKALSVKWISSTPTEEEVLLFGNFNQLMIANIIVDIDNAKQNKLIVETINNFERLCKGIALSLRYDDEQRANIMKILIETEVTDERRDDYFAKIFHKICESREDFSIKEFIEYDRKRSNVLEILRNRLNNNNMFCCNKHDTSMNRINYNNMNRILKLKCIDCKDDALLYCAEQKCKYKLCSNCANMIAMIKQILQNAKNVINIPEYDEMKRKALQIESLKEMKLL